MRTPIADRSGSQLWRRSTLHRPSASVRDADRGRRADGMGPRERYDLTLQGPRNAVGRRGR